MTSIHTQAAELLAATREGHALTPQDFALVQHLSNGHPTAVSEAAEVAFAELYQSVMAGTYDASGCWFHGIEGLTRDAEGYVYWRGRGIEHYSFQDKDAEARAAQVLAAKCLDREQRGVPVTSRTVLYGAFGQISGDSRWLPALLAYYTVLGHADGRVVAVFQSRQHAVAFIGVNDALLTVLTAEDTDDQRACLTLFRTLWDQEGFRSLDVSLDDFPLLQATFLKMGLTSGAVAEALAH